MTISAQTSTSSTPTPQGSGTVVVNGQRYVLVPEKTFSKIELMTAELPALRDENKALKAKDENSELIIAKQVQLISLKDQIIASQDKALVAADTALRFEKEAGRLDREAVQVAKARITELEGKVKRANRRAFISGVVAGVALFFVFR